MFAGKRGLANRLFKIRRCRFSRRRQMFYDGNHRRLFILHIHLDPLGGIAGDMFIAALSDAFPALKLYLEQVISEAGFSTVAIRYSAQNDGVLVGLGFKVLFSENPTEPVNGRQHKHQPSDASESEKHEHNHHHHAHQHAHQHADDGSHHPHRSYAEIRRILEEAKLPARVREHSLNIFQIIGQAEAEVHGVDVAQIEFHEVGGWDSVIDVVGAACALDYLPEATWSYSSLPLGGGLIITAHGQLPVPAPAVARILRGFVFHDDHLIGERVTPTGAAILKYLNPQTRLPAEALELKQVGHGFGTKRFPGLSNILRVLSFDAPLQTSDETVTVFNFEVDDMTSEELAVGLEKLRNTDGVLDVVQTPGYGKKNRVTMSIRVLARPDSAEPIVKEILSQTTTLGVRHQTVARTTLKREMLTVEQGKIRVKVAHRPGGVKTAKADIDDVVSASGNYYELRRTAAAAETSVIKDSNE